MTPDTERPSEVGERIKELFMRLEPLGEAERQAIIADELGDDPVARARIARLLAAGDSADDTMFESLVRRGHETGSIEVPRRVGPYRIEGRLGIGGMAAVYRAVQDHPIRRTVAVKILRPGIDSADVLARFEAERAVLARLQHRNIATVFDAGADPYGPSWFAMELVDGPTITEYVANEELDLEATMRLFVQVCRGVHHAHLRGIIHRDLKPSNILVAIEDCHAVPKIIDFGVAKALGADSPLAGQDRTLATQLVGTLEYMSPEQSRFGNPDVDARADVYALGVVLYEMLTGRHPIGGEAFGSLPLDEIQRRIREEAPRRPSAAGGVPTEFDCVLLKALEKDPCERYESARELADDVDRFLAGEPITARPATSLERTRLFVRRHRSLVAGTGAVILTLVVGLAGTLIGLQRAASARDELQETVVELETSRSDLAAALADATEIARLKGELLLGIEPDRDGRDVTLRDSLVAAAERLLAEPGDRRVVVGNVAASMAAPLDTLGEEELGERIANLAFEALDGLDDADSRRQAMSMLYRRGRMRFSLGRIAESEADFREGLRRAEATAGPLAAFRYEFRGSLSEVLDANAKHREALDLRLAALEDLETWSPEDDAERAKTLALIGRGYSRLGDSARGFEFARRGFEVRERSAPPGDPALIQARRNLAVVALEAARPEESRDLLAVNAAASLEAYGPEHMQTLYDRTLLGVARARAGDAPADEVLASLRATMETSERVIPATTHLFFAAYEVTALAAYGRVAEALDRAETLVARGVETFGAATSRQFQLRLMIALAFDEFGPPEEARPMLESLRDDLLAVVEDDDALLAEVRRALASDAGM